ncbi:MAG TPA: PEP-CTERM sorting domain-containing protein [Usitatibacter sp.]|nr:PEP-CTERM sorting domain-containing protein [Usitatibacter sp.]
MRSHFRFVALAATLLGAASAYALPQAPGANPLSRGSRNIITPVLHDVFDSPLERNAIARPTPAHDATPVTPVPEPSEWLMLAAGLGAGLFVVRRGARRP